MNTLLRNSLGAVCCLTLLSAAPAGAAEHGSEKEAQEMVKKAVALVKSAGPESAYKAFTEHPDGAFKDRDLYVFVYDFGGICLAQGANPKMVGKNLAAIKDVDGNPFIQGMIDMVKSTSRGWYGPYKFTNPNSQGYELKRSYCERGAGDTMVCVGTYFVK
ncbi:histidine kinase [Duganella sp. BJB488]|uniref:cache domain-containing protein n=1 Tax=unclassified Duganella TaxID=2636909 RepID=UPI000E344E9A|nr:MULTISPECIES: cache domain-containing protein [unclassified Duganella]NVD69916.1 cache domain-containing protein [Duganella sp. BJB1802]RFP12287.1 histidine kinase [Duganella sp. BJB488]RFP20073.1 histidine kinase [Duganella sp. BJB489]RFP33620.1 histidine kinase [Duganella sp. BJB480]